MAVSEAPGKRGRRAGQGRGATAWTMLAFLLLLLSPLLVGPVSALRPESLPRLFSRDYVHLDNLSPLVSTPDPSAVLDHRKPTSLLSRILIPRIPGSKGNKLVQRVLTEPFERPGSKWNVSMHTFTASTPKGKVDMTNIIVSRHPDAPRQLVLAAHHDSKISPSGFIGATDSAVPCAIIVDTALALESLMDDAKGTERWEQTGLQLIFFDGEEAYNMWSRTDSTYGSRALASYWAKLFYAPPSSLQPRRTGPGLSTMRRIDSIEHFVLLDLLGTPHPRIPTYYPNTAWMHDELRSVESRLARAGHLFPKRNGVYELPPPGSRSAGTDALTMPDGASTTQHSFFTNDGRTMFGIEDDHLPFLANGVPICHLIPNPFPAVWHRSADDASCLDYPTVHAWAMIMRVFVAEYLGLRPAGSPVPRRRDPGELVSGCIDATRSSLEEWC